MVTWLKLRLARWVLRDISIEDFCENLPRVRAGYGGYSEMDRYADFRAVFFGNSTAEQGRRVFTQIIDECQGALMSEREIESHALLAARQGAIRIGKKIEAWATSEPALKEVNARS